MEVMSEIVKPEMTDDNTLPNQISGKRLWRQPSHRRNLCPDCCLGQASLLYLHVLVSLIRQTEYINLSRHCWSANPYHNMPSFPSARKGAYDKHVVNAECIYRSRADEQSY